MDINRLIDAASAGDPRALGQLCSVVERDDELARKVSAKLYPLGGKAWTTGVTGAPGSGKSTLVAELVGSIMESGDRAAVLAVDPSSPLTGGAILGDRIRMGVHVDNPDVFIRSISSRGHLGGISMATPAMAASLDGIGFSEILVETVGVGQSEVDIASSADTTIVVVTAGWGDAVQTAKAGFLEVADIFVVNKSDRGGADGTSKDIEAMLDVGPDSPWRPPVIRTVATEGKNVSVVADAVREHRQFLLSGDELERRRRKRAANELAMALRASIDQSMGTSTPGSGLIDEIWHRRTDPWTAADRLLSSP